MHCSSGSGQSSKTSLHQQSSSKGSDHRMHVNRLHRIQGQLNSVLAQIESGQYCVGILQQMKSARQAIKSLEMKILEGHLNGCVRKAFQENDPKEIQEKIDEIVGLISKNIQ